MTLRIAAVSTGLWQPSKTSSLARFLLGALANELDADSSFIELGPIAHELGGTLRRDEARARVAHALTIAEEADLLIAATPVFRGAYTGHFKHFFDLVDPNAFVGKPVVLAATGGGSKHCLVVEHQLRPLFAFFQALSLPTSLYASDADFHDYEVTSEAILERVAVIAREASRFVPQISPRLAAPSLGDPRYSSPRQAPEHPTSTI